MNGDKNRSLAKVAGLSLHELSAVLGVSPSALSQLLAHDLNIAKLAAWSPGFFVTAQRHLYNRR